MISKNSWGPATTAAAPEKKRVTSAELLRGDRQLLILHEGQEYRLQVTKNGKLILTK